MTLANMASRAKKYGSVAFSADLAAFIFVDEIIYMAFVIFIVF